MGESVPLDYKKLREVCIAKFEEFKPFGQVRKGKNGEHIFIDKGADILFVAHLDTVSPSKLFSVIEMDSGTRIMSRAMDDRLGAYIGNWWLPLLGVKCDVLFTDGEEVGRSTAEDFEPDKQYNWMFQFDRMGVETVMYDYDSPEMKKIMANLNIKIGRGSFSDICKLEHLGCKGINFATGYYDPHGEWANAHVNTVVNMVNQFIQFYNVYATTHLPHEKKTYSYQYPTNYGAASSYKPDYPHRPTTSPAANHSAGGETGTSKTTGATGNPARVGNRTITKETSASLSPEAVKVAIKKLGEGTPVSRELQNRFESTPPGYFKCTKCKCDVHGNWMLKDSDVCLYCEAGVLPESRLCDICEEYSRASGFDGEDRCIFCVRTLNAHQKYNPKIEICDIHGNVVGELQPALSDKDGPVF